MIKKLIYLSIILPLMLLANTNLEVEIEHYSSHKNPLEIVLKVTNVSDHSMQLDPSNFPSPEGGILGDLFTIFEDGKKVPYIGPMVMLATTKNFTLPAGEHYTGHVNLEIYYGIHNGTHTYEIHYNNSHHHVVSIPLEIEATILTKKRHKKPRSTRKKSCSNAQLSILGGDIQRARDSALKARNYLPATDSNHALYRRWFGSATADRYHIVYSNFSKIYTGLLQHINYNCAPTHKVCQQGAIAYVYPNQAYKINLCSSYWRYPSDRRPSTLIHEMSHFNRVASARDGNGKNTPGKNHALNFAKSAPHIAIHNAYSYQYYALELNKIKGDGNPEPTQKPSNNGGINYEFNANQNTQEWTYAHMIQQYSGPYNGAWFFACNQNDPIMVSPNMNINANTVKKIRIRIANDHNPKSTSQLQVFWKSNGQGFSEANSQRINISNHGGWIEYTIDLRHNPRWSGNINQIRIDPIQSGDGHWIAIDYIRLSA